MLSITKQKACECRSNATPNSPQQNNPLGSPPGAAGSYTLSPAFPGLPSSVPLAYSLALRACLHPEPLERPTFTQLSKVLTEVVSEVAEGVYVNSKGLLQVCLPSSISVLVQSEPLLLIMIDSWVFIILDSMSQMHVCCISSLRQQH